MVDGLPPVSYLVSRWELCCFRQVRNWPGGVQLIPRRYQEVRKGLEVQNCGLRASGDSWSGGSA